MPARVKSIVLALVLVLTSMQVGAQYDPYFSHYFDMQTSFNPAAAGNADRINVYGIYGMSMVGFENAPQTVMFAGDMPFSALKTVHGVGLQFMNDKIGLFNHQRITAQYALRMKMAGGRFSVGASVGMLTEKFKGSEVVLGEDGDPAIPNSDVDGNTVDIGVGLFYSRKNWYAGISAQHLTFPTVSLGEKHELKIDGTFYAMGGVDFQLRNPALKILTSAIVRSDFVSYRADLTGRLQYTFDGKMLYAGLGYSPMNSVTVLVGGRFSGFHVGYSFEAFTNGISFQNGSHELFIGYQMDVDLGKKGKNRHQTTRTL